MTKSMNLDQLSAFGRLTQGTERNERDLRETYESAKGLDGDDSTLSERDLDLYIQAHPGDPDAAAKAGRLRAILAKGNVMDFDQLYAAGRLYASLGSETGLGATPEERIDLQLAYLDAKGLDGDGSTLSERDLDLFVAAHPERRREADRLRQILQLSHPAALSRPTTRSSGPSRDPASEAVTYVALKLERLESNQTQGPMVTQSNWQLTIDAPIPARIAQAVRVAGGLGPIDRRQIDMSQVDRSQISLNGVMGPPPPFIANVPWVGRSKLSPGEMDEMRQTVWDQYRRLPNAAARSDFLERVSDMMKARTGRSLDGSFNASVKRMNGLLTKLGALVTREQAGQSIPELTSATIPS